LKIFSISDLREHADDLVREASSGRLSVVTKHGEPIFLAVPFDESLLRGGLAIALATRLFDEETISLGQAARLAGMEVTEFMELLSRLKIPVARPRRGELEQETETFS
jgi:prevent-host-death family protein